MRTLLIIDDDEATRRLLRARFADAYAIIDTSDPEEGLVLALQRKPDAILLDLMMPKYSGFEVCQTLASMSFTQRIPVLIISGESAERYRDFCTNLGAKRFFQKPFDVGTLRKQLEAVICGESSERAEARVRFRTPLKLSGRNSKGSPLQVITVTENVTGGGFLYMCAAEIEKGTVVEVHLATDAGTFVGRARVGRIDFAGTRGQTCDFQFLEAPRDWVLP